jgi:hypothetical protein
VQVVVVFMQNLQLVLQSWQVCLDFIVVFDGQSGMQAPLYKYKVVSLHVVQL